MPNVTLYLPDDLHAYAKAHDLRLSPMLQAAVQAYQDSQDPLLAKFAEELEKYRNDPERRAEWDRDVAGSSNSHAFVPCEVCGTAVDEAEGCMAMFEPYSAAPVAILAHYPDDLRRASLQYWADSGFKDVALGPQ